jgi:hypothetical protein
MALRVGFPALDVTSEHSDSELAGQLWPLVRPMCTNILEVGETYTIEGAYLLPWQAQELVSDFPGQVRGVFLGYADIDPDAKFQAVRSARGMPNDWLEDLPDAILRDFVQERINESAQIRKQCLAYGLPYFETSRGFATQLTDAATFLLSPENGE